MKVNSRLIALMAALAAGSAAAASAGTTAGTAIQNIAQASFTDPSTGNPATPVNSNPVYTTVNAIPAFDIVYSDGSADGTTAAVPAPSYSKTGVLPGASVDTAYTVVNNGNVDNYVVNLTASTSTSANAPTSVTYYLATDTTFSTPITSVTLPNGGQVAIVQRIMIPTTAVAGTTYSASPAGTAAAGSINTTLPGGTVVNTTYAAVDEKNNVNPPALTPTNDDLQFTKATIFTPTVVTFPTVPTDPTNPTTPTTPTTPVVTPPTANPVDPTNPVSPPGTPADTTSDPSQPGYVDPNPLVPANPGTPIVVDPAGNNQIAYPPADTDSTPDRVTFNNIVATPVATGTPADTVSLFPTAPGGGAPTSVYDPVTKSFPITTPNGPATVQFLDPVTKLPLPTAVNPADGKAYPILTIPAGGGSVPYLTVVTYPDSNSVTDPVDVVVTVGVDSGNDSNINSNGTTTDTIKPPAAAFGDVPASGTTADPSLIGAGNIAQVVVPGTAATTGAPSATATGDSSAVFPMTINNTGQYNDTYTLAGSVPIKLANGTIVNVPVKYVDASGNALPSGTATATATTLANGAVVPAGTPTYVTPLVLANGNTTVYAIVDVPAGAALTNATNPNPMVAQIAVGNFSTIPMEDTTNDQIKIGSIGGITVVKTQAVNTGAYGTANATAKPGDTLKYKIVATNSYNASVFNFKLSDSASNNAFTYTNFVSAAVSVTGFGGQTPALASAKAFYSTDGGTTFSDFTTAPTAAAVAAGGLVIAIDTNGSNSITAADEVPGGATITLDIETTVK